MARTSVVAGGSGFIGSHLCEYLLQKGEHVIVIDNLGSGDKGNISGLEGNDHFTFIKHDIRKPLKVEGHVDHVYNLASRASPVDFATHPVEIMMTNSQGTYNLINMAIEHDASFLMASTSESYGDPDVSPQPETYWGHVNPVGPRSCYDESKRFSEALTMTFIRHHGLNGRIIRIFNTYGPRMRLDDGRVVPNFIGQRVAVDDRQVGQLALGHGADVLVRPERFGGGPGRGDQGLGRGKAVLDHPLDLEPDGQARVAAERDLDARLPRGPHAGRALLDVPLRQFRQHRRHVRLRLGLGRVDDLLAQPRHPARARNARPRPSPPACAAAPKPGIDRLGEAGGGGGQPWGNARVSTSAQTALLFKPLQGRQSCSFPTSGSVGRWPSLLSSRAR